MLVYQTGIFHNFSFVDFFALLLVDEIQAYLLLTSTNPDTLLVSKAIQNVLVKSPVLLLTQFEPLKIPWLIDCYSGSKTTWFTGDHDNP